VFRKSTPYSFPGGTSLIVNKNNARLVEVWLDEWKEFYYNINPGNLFSWFSFSLLNILTYLTARCKIDHYFYKLINCFELTQVREKHQRAMFQLDWHCVSD
jgi:hypothetical protein